MSIWRNAYDQTGLPPFYLGLYSRKPRNSSIELLKLAACIMIVFSHSFPRGIPSEAAPYLIDPSQATTNNQYFWILVVKYLGQVGNSIFIASSSYFLLRSREVKVHKVFSMIRDSFLISVLFLGAMLLIGYRFPAATMIKQFIPITMNTNWFVGCYILYYLLHPALNVVIASFDQRKHMNICLMIILLYCGINAFLPGRYYYTQLIGFVIIHILVSYMELYLPRFAGSRKQNFCLLLVSLTSLYLQIRATNAIGLRIGVLSDMADWFSNISNPLIIAIGISSFNLARTICFQNRFINYLSGLTMLIYITHANELVMDYLKPDFFAWVYHAHSYGNILFWCFLFGLFLLFSGTLLSVLYHELIAKHLYHLWERMFQSIISLWNRLISFLIMRS